MPGWGVCREFVSLFMFSTLVPWLRRALLEDVASDGSGPSPDAWRDSSGFGRLQCMIRAAMFFFSRFYPTPQAVGRR
jgi:hypothetical protein